MEFFVTIWVVGAIIALIIVMSGNKKSNERNKKCSVEDTRKRKYSN
jgi:hypothetical protein